MKKPILEVHFGVLSEKQTEVFPKLKNFSEDFVLAGGTAIALQLAHRKSYDLDLFSKKLIPKDFLRKINRVFGTKNVKLLLDTQEQLDVKVSPGVKLTFVYYEFSPLYPLIKTRFIDIFNLRDLASDKAYTIGRRPMWRDYVDIFFLLKHGIKLEEIIKDANRKFGENFNEKLFLSQLTYFEDIKTFSVEYIKKPYSKEEIRQFFLQKTKKLLAKIK